MIAIFLHLKSDISIHALREEGDRRCHACASIPRGISIHALREEGDRLPRPPCLRSNTISIHALREEGDYSRRSYILFLYYFYPRPP